MVVNSTHVYIRLSSIIYLSIIICKLMVCNLLSCIYTPDEGIAAEIQCSMCYDKTVHWQYSYVHIA